MTNRKHKIEEEPEDFDLDEEDEGYCATQFNADALEQRTIFLCGIISGNNGPAAVNALLSFYEAEKARIDRYRKEVPENEAQEEFLKFRPVKFFINSGGGNADDMFAICDTMEYVQKQGLPVHTIALGSAKSAAIPILAYGTKGERYAGRHTRFMLHSIGGTGSGALGDILLDVKELEWAQENYIQMTLERSNLTKKFLKKIVSSNTNHYFDVNEALKFGIIDKIY